jgi:hypothetical protein
LKEDILTDANMIEINKNLKVEFSAEELAMVVKILSKLRYKDVAPVIDLINGRVLERSNQKE